jgi:2,4-dienoyl-CoA reductase-like NADH-dependent reductase (Old Yellow Enzyme family)
MSNLFLLKQISQFMSLLFEEFSIGDLTLRNRFCRSPTTSYWSDEEGILRDPIIEYYKQLAKGGIGLIIKGHSYVSEKGKAHIGQSGLSSEKHIPRMKELTDIVHSYDSKIIAQLNHAGYTGVNERVTASKYVTEKWEARELSLDEIEEIIENFSNAAENAISAGFDGVQLHGAHGYVVSQFMSDNVNHRLDKYGGSFENRIRLLTNIYDAVRRNVGSNILISVKLNCDDFAEEKGLTINDSIQIARILSEKKLDFLEISGGGPEQVLEIRKNRGRASEGSGYEEATWGGHAKKIREAVPGIVLALVDGIRTRKTMDNLIDQNIVDLISMSKPFINEPNFVELLEKGQEKASCIDCRKCISRENFAKTMLRCFHKHPYY